MVQLLAESPRRLDISSSRLDLDEEYLERLDFDELLGTVAHELRSPLAAIISGVSVIAESGDVGPSVQEELANIKQQLWQAIRLVEDLFDLSAGGLGKLSVHTQVVDVADVVAEAAAATDPLVASRQHRLTISLPPAPLYLDADPLRLTQVLTNLLCNAAKFTDPGGHIRLTASMKYGQVEIRVQDNGRGIPNTLLPHVFDLFRQIPGRGHTGGMGIGLALVKSLVELHGGTVAASSNDTGSEFIVRLPARANGIGGTQAALGGECLASTQ